MADSGLIVMPANNDTVQVIAPAAANAWQTVAATGSKDINVLVYVSGYQDQWADGQGWAVVDKRTIGPAGVVFRVPPAPHLCIRAQGPEGDSCRVVTY